MQVIQPKKIDATKRFASSLRSRRELLKIPPKPFICKNAENHYRLSAEEKEKFLFSTEAVNLLIHLPVDIAQLVISGFLYGERAEEIPNWSRVVKYFNENSSIIPELTKNPGTFSMLERVYTLNGISGAIDNYFYNCLGGQALRNRLNATILYARDFLRDRTGNQLILNLGSGSARDTITLSAQDKNLAARTIVHCLDIDKEANQRGIETAKELRVDNHLFFDANILTQRSKYRASADLGFLIGILCPLDTDSCIQYLSVIRRYFKKGGQVVAATLLEEMLIRDLLCAYLLREITGWQLRYRRKGELQFIFEAAGYKYNKLLSFSDEPTNFYEIGVGII